MELFLPVRGHGHLQPLRGGLDGGHPGELFLGQDADRRKLRKAANRLGSTDFARRPGALDEVPRRGALLLADLGVTKSHSRPHVQDDNPYSESHFKTLKYRPEFPRRFGSIQDAREFCREFFRWYNTEHRHSEIGLHTPEDVHLPEGGVQTSGAGSGSYRPPLLDPQSGFPTDSLFRRLCPQPSGSIAPTRRTRELTLH